MKKIGMFACSFVAILGVTSCGIFSKHVWNWDNSTHNDTIKYCLLIGQEDHNDSMDRTRGTRIAMDTRPDKEHQKTNYNLEAPKVGSITLGQINDAGEEIVPLKKYTVKESEHAEMKSLSGTTWDPITANETAANWTAKHGNNITLFVSNNDGMAEGALGACGWYQGMPLFGYDANLSTLRYITEDKIMGTIDSNTPAQCLASSILIRNIFEYNQACKSNPALKAQKFNPCSKGFRAFYPAGTEVNVFRTDYGYLNSNVTFDGCSDEDVDNPNAHHAILVDNNAVTKFEDVKTSHDPEGDRLWFKEGERVSVYDYFKEDKKTPLDPDERVKNGEPFAHKKDDGTTHESISVSQTYYSATDVFFTGNMQKYFDIFQPMFDLDVVQTMGDGTDEKVLLDKFQAAGRQDAYLINVVKQPDAMKFLDIIAGFNGATPKDKWEDRDPTPILFWNRQPTNESGEISTDVMNDKRFKFVYYVGFGAKQGGELQGKMIASYLNHTYVSNYQK